MDSRIITAVVLSIAVIVGWNMWYSHRYGDLLEQNRAAKMHQSEAIVEKPKSRNLLEPAAEPSAFSPFEGGAVKEKGYENPGNLITLDTGVTKISLSRRGGVITSLRLLKYLDEEGNPIELVNQRLLFKPLAIEFATVEATEKINTAIFSASVPRDNITLTPGNPSATIALTYSLENGFRMVKKLTFYHESYQFDLEVGMSQPGMSTTGSSFGLMWPGLGEKIESSYSYEGPVVLIKDKRLTETPDDGEKMVYEGDVDWAGLTNKYYCMAFLPASDDFKVVNRKIEEKTYSTTLRLVTHGSGSSNRITMYVGPKSHEELGKLDRNFMRMINYGWLDVLAAPLYKLLIWFYGFTGNLGWAIIVLTIVIKVCFFPLTQKSFTSMKKMQKVQPKLKVLQQRYKNDKTKLNEELVALYKDNKINPLGGCLPMLLQIPVFIALYKVLLQSIELKGAHFIWWLTDLSAKDPYYVTPILMGISMFAQQKLSPAGSDPMQRNIMLAMPVIFTIMFLRFPSGLVIYWLISNILSILQQYYINRSHRYEVA